ncbi:unnamed protein product [Cunninghamella blakesleeana]
MEVIENNNSTTFTTSVMPSFTFIVDGPGTSKHNQDAKSSHSQTNNNNNNNNNKNHHKTLEINNNSRPIPPGPLHIITSWQPSHPEEKPPYSYATLIAHAILSSEHRRLTLSEIYKWITTQYPFYKIQDNGWQNSIRHNLSLNKGFMRIQRSSAPTSPTSPTTISHPTSGRGNYWTIRIGYEQSFIDNLIKRRPVNKQTIHNLPRPIQKRRSSISSTTTTTSTTFMNNNNSNDDNNFHNMNDNESISSVSTNTFSGNNSPLFTTFKMITPSTTMDLLPSSSTTKKTTRRKKSMPELHHHPIYHHHHPPKDQKQRRRSTIAIPKIEEELDSDCDSGIDVRQDFLLSHIKKSKSISSFKNNDIYNYQHSHFNINNNNNNNNNNLYYNDPIPSSSSSSFSFIGQSISTPLLQHYHHYNNNNNNNNTKLMNTITTTTTPLLQYANLNLNDDHDLSSFWYNNNYMINNNYSTNLNITNQQEQLPLHPQSSSSSSSFTFHNNNHPSFSSTFNNDHLYNNNNNNNNIQPDGYIYQDHDLVNDFFIL